MISAYLGPHGVDVRKISEGDYGPYEGADGGEPIWNLSGVIDCGVDVSSRLNGIKNESEQVHLCDHTKTCLGIKVIHAVPRFFS